MTRSLRMAVLTAFSSVCVMAQTTFVYTSSDPDNLPNSVSVFAVDASGTLLPKATFPTGGLGGGGGYFGSKHMLASAQGRLYVMNGGSQEISVFTIDSATGMLGNVPGSPFATGYPVMQAAHDISLAVSPDEKFLFAANAATGRINAFQIAANGALNLLAGSGISFNEVIDHMKVTEDGKYLVVANLQGGVNLFAIGSSGVLTRDPELHAPTPGFSSGADCDCLSSYIFIATGNDIQKAMVDVYQIANGSLVQVPGAPFTGIGDNSTNIVLSPGDRFAFVVNQASNSISAFSVAANGTLAELQGSPFAITGTWSPYDLVTNAAGDLLFVNSLDGKVSVFHIAGNGSLTPSSGSPFLADSKSIATFPPKTCGTVPVIRGATASPAILWPPDHKFVPVTVSYSVSASSAVTNRLTVSSNELSSGTPDWQVIDDHHVLLRAERSGQAAERIYTITITSTSVSNGNSATAAVRVVVPHNQPK